jgi:hypothetical protein
MNNFFKIISILNKKERKAFFLIILLSFLNSILDFLSIGAIYPLTSSLNLAITFLFVVSYNG